LLLVGFYLAYRRPKAVLGREDGCDCDLPHPARKGKVWLWIATALAVLFAAYPYVAAALSGDVVAREGASEDAAMTFGERAMTTLQIGGMSCESCASEVAEALTKVEGVIGSDVNFDRKLATVTYNPRKTNPELMVKAVETIGYSASRVSTP